MRSSFLPVLFASILLVGSSRASVGSEPLTADVTGLNSSRGRVGCTLYSRPAGFPKDAAAARQRIWCPIAGAQATCPFAPIPAGAYAVACFHDANGNGALDTGLFGIPVEQTGASNDARGRFGPPSWNDARFDFTGRATTISIHLH